MPYRKRQWWYRGWRWLVYRWARVRSATVRFSRKLENRFDREEPRDIPLVEKTKKEVGQPNKDGDIDETPGTNGAKPQPVELPAPPSPETEEKVLETEQYPNGSSKGE
jgi:hypothetical protein